MGGKKNEFLKPSFGYNKILFSSCNNLNWFPFISTGKQSIMLCKWMDITACLLLSLFLSLSRLCLLENNKKVPKTMKDDIISRSLQINNNCYRKWTRWLWHHLTTWCLSSVAVFVLPNNSQQTLPIKHENQTCFRTSVSFRSENRDDDSFEIGLRKIWRLFMQHIQWKATGAPLYILVAFLLFFWVLNAEVLKLWRFMPICVCVRAKTEICILNRFIKMRERLILFYKCNCGNWHMYSRWASQLSINECRDALRRRVLTAPPLIMRRKSTPARFSISIRTAVIMHNC